MHGPLRRGQQRGPSFCWQDTSRLRTRTPSEDLWPSEEMRWKQECYRKAVQPPHRHTMGQPSRPLKNTTKH